MHRRAPHNKELSLFQMSVLQRLGNPGLKRPQKQDTCIFKELVICYDFFSRTKCSLPSLIWNSWVGILFLTEASPNCIVSGSHGVDCPCTGSLGSFPPIPGFALAVSLLCCFMPIYIDML